LVLTGFGAVDGTGNGLDNRIVGNSGPNRLDGRRGSDTLEGGDGDDTYTVDTPSDRVIEQAEGGSDTVRAGLSWTLEEQVEALVLTGAGPLSGTGNTLSNRLTGNDDDNTLDGVAGRDTLAGRGGNDTYLVDAPGERVLEAAGGGLDTVFASLSFALPAEVEDLILTGAGPTAGTGNGLPNRITGNSGHNTLDGSRGVDTLLGGEGDDLYVVDSPDDRVVERAEGGTDTVRASVSVTLPGHVENLVLIGTGALSGTGNALANMLSGNGGRNLLTGGRGNDSLVGGDGTDTAAFSGSTAGYRVSHSGTSVQISDRDPSDGTDGTDTLREMETLRFADRDLTLVPGTGELRVNPVTDGAQLAPSVAALADGGFVVGWETAYQQGVNWGLYARHYDTRGIPEETAIRLDPAGSSHPWQVDLTGLPDGGFLATWTTLGEDELGWTVVARRFDPSGTALGGTFQVNSGAGGDQLDPRAATLADGGFVLAWTSHDQDGEFRGVYAHRYGSDGLPVGAELQVNTCTADSQFAPSVAGLGDGGFVVVWTSYGQDGSAGGVYGRRFDAIGSAPGGEFRVNTATAGQQDAPAAAGVADGGFVVAWASDSQDGGTPGLFARRFNAQGDPLGPQFRVNTRTDGHQDDPDIAALPGGGFVVTWTAYRPDGTGFDVFLRRYDADGTPVTGEVTANTHPPGTQDKPCLAALNDGGFVAAWTSDEQDGSGDGVYAQAFGPDGHARLPELRGTPADDVIQAGGGDQALSGLAGDDSLVGGAGADSLAGGPGADTLAGGAGADTLVGGRDADRFVFDTPPGPARTADTLPDFRPGQDLIELHSAAFPAFAGQVGDRVGLGPHLAYDRVAGDLSYDADGAGPGAGVLLARLEPGLVLGADFLIAP
jgi:Ca2+-binding RTX toxin-like protein